MITILPVRSQYIYSVTRRTFGSAEYLRSLYPRFKFDERTIVPAAGGNPYGRKQESAMEQRFRIGQSRIFRIWQQLL